MGPGPLWKPTCSCARTCLANLDPGDRIARLSAQPVMGPGLYTFAKGSRVDGETMCEKQPFRHFPAGPTKF